MVLLIDTADSKWQENPAAYLLRSYSEMKADNKRHYIGHIAFDVDGKFIKVPCQKRLAVCKGMSEDMTFHLCAEDATEITKWPDSESSLVFAAQCRETRPTNGSPTAKATKVLSKTTKLPNRSWENDYFLELNLG